MVVCGHAGCFQLVRFCSREVAQGYANFHSELADLANGLEHLLEFRVTVADAFPCGTHAKARRTVCPRALSYIEHVARAHKFPGFDTRLVTGALRTVRTVF